MRLILQLIFSCLIALSFTNSHAHASQQQPEAVAMLKRVNTSVVNIKVYGATPVGDNAETESEEEPPAKKNQENKKPHRFIAEGSGIIINAKNGYILTNAHVLADSKKIVVTLQDGQQFLAKTIGIDEPSDIALIQITAPNLTELLIANSNTLEVGDSVYAIGNPFGFGNSVSSGIVSALDRNNLNLDRYENFIQIDAPINPGSSGGALLNTKGEVVGMNSAIYTSEDGGNIGIGFAIPSNMLTAVIPQLIKYGKVERGIIGFSAQTFSVTLANAMNLPHQEGAIITSVMPLSPAKKAGLRVGDVITKIDDVPIHTASQVVNTVGFLRTGEKVKLSLLRQKQIIEVSVTIMDAKKQKELVQKETPYFNNISLQNFSFYSPENGNVNGVILVEVEIDSAAWLAGLRPGDIVISANDEPATSVKNLQNTIAKAKETLTLLILRNHDTAFVVLTPEGVSNDE